MQKILIINPFGIGDVLFTTPVIKAIKSALPNTRVSYWCNERIKGILVGNPDIDKIFALSRGDLKKIYRASKIRGIKKFLSLLSSIKKEKFDITIDFSLDHRYSLIAKILGIKRRIGFNYKNRGRFLTEKKDITGYHDKHIVEWYLELLKFLQIQPKDKRLELPILKADKISAGNILNRLGVNHNDLVIGIAPGAGASWGRDAQFKHWPADNFAQLIDKLVEAFGAKIVILGDDLEKHIVDTIRRSAKEEFIDLVGATDLKQLIAIISNLKLLITNDGGPMHIAAAVGTKTVSIFGPVDELVYGPYPALSGHIVVKADIGCRPCYRQFRLPLCERNRECIKSIGVEEVFAAARRLL